MFSVKTSCTVIFVWILFLYQNSHYEMLCLCKLQFDYNLPKSTNVVHLFFHIYTLYIAVKI